MKTASRRINVPPGHRSANWLAPAVITAFSLLVFVEAIPHVSAQTCTAPPSGMLNWWPGDNNPDDIQGSRAGTLQNGADFAPGKVGRAFSLDGVNDYVIVGDVDLPGTFTIDAWINPTDLANEPIIIAKDNPPATSYVLQLRGDGTLIAIVASASGYTFYETNSPAIVAGTWQHLAVTYDGNGGNGQKLLVYVNGALKPTFISGGDAGGTPNNNSVPATIGTYGDNFGNRFKGLIDEVETFGRVLSGAEIAALYNAGAAGKCKPVCVAAPADMVSWWPGDGHAFDIQSTNNGTYNGAYADGRVGQAFDLNGNFVSFGNPANLQLTEITVDAWISPDSTSGGFFQTVASKWSQSPSNSSWGLFLVDSGNGTAHIEAYVNNSGGAITGAVGGVIPLGTGEWTHVAMTYSAADGIRGYVNGVAVNAGGSIGDMQISTADARIGNDSDNPGRSFDGRVDEVEVFSRVLSQAEVNSIYQAGSAGKCKAASVVINTNNDGPGSLRRVLALAQFGDTITFDLGPGPHTITLTSGELAIAKNVSIVGPGSSLLTVNGNNNGRIFNIAAGNTVSMSGLALATGVAPNAFAVGGALLSAGVTTINDCVFLTNFADSGGGAICVTGGTMNINRSTFENNDTGNSGGSPGGAVYANGPSSIVVNITNSTFYNNRSEQGGAIASFAGTTNLSSLTLSGNAARGGGTGGGIRNGSLLTINNSIVANNTPNDISAFGGTISGDYNLIASGPGFDSGGTHNIAGAPLLGPLQNNGGQTPTMAPQPGSAAIDQGKAFGLTTDQRGSARPVRYSDTIVFPDGGDFSDIGAVEVAKPICTTLLPQTLAAMVSWWTGDGNTTDIKDGNNGFFGPSGTGTYAPGKVQEAFSFNGTNQDVFLGNPTNLQVSSITIDAWIYPTSVPPASELLGIVTKWTQGLNNGDNFGFWTQNNGTADTMSLLGLVVDTAGELHGVSGGSIPINAFSHVAITYNAATGSTVLYVNGIQILSNPGSANPMATKNSMIYIGSEAEGAGRFFQGVIDEVEIFNAAIPAAEIAAIYNAGAGGKCKPCLTPPADMVAWWPGDGHGRDLQNGNDASPRNGAGYATGHIGKAFNFIGNQWFEVANSDMPLNLTVDAWINPSNVTGNHDIVYKGNSAYVVQVRNGTVVFASRDSAAINAELQGTLPVPANAWTHVAVTHNGSTKRIYVNGVLDPATQSQSGLRQNDFNPLLIGASPAFADFFAGAIDEVEIFSRALTGGEVQAIYAAGLHAPVSATDFSNVGKCKPPPTVQFALAAYPAGELNGPVTLTVTRTGDPSMETTVDYATSDGTAASGSDYTAKIGTVTFGIGEKSKTISITILNDSSAEAAETFNVTLSNQSAGAVLGTPSVAAVTIAPSDSAVTNTNDFGPGSLRQAIAEADPGASLVLNLGAGPHTITLTSGELLIDKNLTINGPGANLLAISGNNATRVFQITPGRTVNISGLTVSNANGANVGGAIYNDGGTLVLANCAFTLNSAGYGGAIYNTGYSAPASLTISNCTFNGNFTPSTSSGFSDGPGGAILNDGAFDGNATLIVTNSTFSGNSAPGNKGGAIMNSGSNNGTAALTVLNCTFSGNSATGGGAIYNDADGGGAATCQIGNTILKAGSSGANIHNDQGTVTSQGYNLSSDSGVTNTNGGTGSLNATGDQTSADPLLLGALANNGGPTLTHALLPGSPAIDKGKNLAVGTTTDQRGGARPFDNASISSASGGDGSDIGAVEDTAVQLSADTNSVTEGTANASITVQRLGNPVGPVTAKVTITDVTTSPADYVFTPGALDTSFDPGNGADSSVYATAVQADGKVIIGGNFTSYNDDDSASDHIARLNANGTLDTSFNYGNDGMSDDVFVVAVQADGKILVGGGFFSYNSDPVPSAIVRLNSEDGTVDTSFNAGGAGADSYVDLIALQPDGKIIIGGNFTSYNGVAAPYLARLNADGTLDTTFNPGAGPTFRAFALRLQPDGKIIIGGAFTTYNGTPVAKLARINPDGSLDPTFNPGTGPDGGFISALLVQPDGKIVIGGAFTSYNGNAAASDNLARVNSDGTLDTTFNPGGTGPANGAGSSSAGPLALQPDGKIIVAGRFTSYNGDFAASDQLLRVNTNGTLDTSFNYGGAGANLDPSSVALQSDGRIVVGGDFAAYNGVSRNRIARVTGDLFVTWAAGDTTDKIVSLPIVNDADHEDLNETLTFTVVPVAGAAAVGSYGSQTLTIVDNDNIKPVANNQSPNTNEDTAIGITLTGSDADTTPSDSLTFTVVTGPSHGLLTGTAPGLTYTPEGNYSGPDSFTFKVNDGREDSVSNGTITITVNAVNDTPTANSQPISTNEDTSKNITLTGSDVETSSGNLSFAITASPANGLLTGTPPNVTYTPASNYNGSDSFKFTVTDTGDGASPAATSTEATVSITVNAINDAPVANAQPVSTNEDTNKGITLTGSDAENDALTFTVLTGPTNGALSGTAPNLTYTPANNYNGADSFTFKVNDGQADSAVTATVSITVNAVNDAPTANAQVVSTNEDTAKGITLTGSDVENDSLTFTVVTGPAHGALSGSAPALTYTPASNYNGPDTFTFKVNDGQADSAPAATVSITVTAVNDGPTANADSVSTNEDTAKGVTLTGSDTETASSSLIFNVTASPAHGVLSGTAPTLTYTPTANYNGPDSFKFTVTDTGDGASGASTSSEATVSITVDPVNDTPTANAQAVSTNANTAKAITLTGTDTETASGSLAFTITDSPTHGTITGTPPAVTYTPAGNYSGPDSFQFTVTDTADGSSPAATSSKATVSITVNAQPTPTPSPTPSATPTPSPTPTPAPTATPTPSPTPTPGPTAAQSLNISTRLKVDIGDKVMIAGFIIQGNASKPVLLRGMGPFLSLFQIKGFLQDPVLDLRDDNGSILMNDNWVDSPQRSQIEGSPFQPGDNREAVILATLPAGQYSAIQTGANQSKGVGLVEVYDNGQAVDAQLANISTRGFVEGDESVMIGGFILGGNSNNARIVLRGIGPSLSQFQLNPVLGDPVLELKDANGTTLIANDNWTDDTASAALLTANGFALGDPKEAGIFTSLPPGQFTAILSGKNGGIGIGLIELYNLK
jgi:uncharacterized delta-60 repeat protein